MFWEEVIYSTTYHLLQVFGVFYFFSLQKRDNKHRWTQRRHHFHFKLSWIPQHPQKTVLSLCPFVSCKTEDEPSTRESWLIDIFNLYWMRRVHPCLTASSTCIEWGGTYIHASQHLPHFAWSNRSPFCMS